MIDNYYEIFQEDDQIYAYFKIYYIRSTYRNYPLTRREIKTVW